MDLSKIISVTGKSGLFKLVSQTRTGILVESLTDKTRMPVHSTQNVSSLEEISVFTTGEDMPLKDVFKRIYEALEAQPGISHKSQNEELKAFMAKVLPEYDSERVYVSDIKKITNWYNILLEQGLLTPLEAEEAKEEGGTEEAESAGEEL